jgi:SAM-dependent methyltransferase
MKPARGAGKAIVKEDAMKPDPIRVAIFPFTGSSHPVSVVRQVTPAPKGKLKYGPAGPSHWSAFWRDFGVESQPHERCYIPGDGRPVVDQHWADFANDLPQRAQVIDLGCGAGILGRLLLGCRRDLHVTGVDFAKVPAIFMPNLTIHPWVHMEDLPFGNGSFDAAVSLFGIEYGNMEDIARELGRVLKSGGHFRFLVHHHESEIVREGATRQRGLRELLSGKLKSAFLAGGMAGFDQQQQRLRSRFPDEPSVKLFSDHFRRNIEGTRAERQAMWQKMADDLEPELTLTMQMERSAKSAAQMGAWLVPLITIMKEVRVSVLRRRSGEPIAWSVGGVR